jgi:hypothetical protein
MRCQKIVEQILTEKKVAPLNPTKEKIIANKKIMNDYWQLCTKIYVATVWVGYIHNHFESPIISL